MWNLRVWQIRVLALVACVLLPFAVSAQVSQDQFDRTSLFRNLLEASYCIGTIDRKLEQTNVCSNLQKFQAGEVRDHWERFCKDNAALKDRYLRFLKNNDFRMRYSSASSSVAQQEGRSAADACTFAKIRKICPTYQGECVNKIPTCARMNACETPRAPF
ncbi:MAG: hypothetical protein NTZ22_10560 [Hyphomicrobiales bacterium]|nr:hypothetical protein [Hyphomicrobiales bacterium]